MSGRDFKPGILFAVQWLHERAASMNDPHAKAILNSAAFHLGRARARGETKLLPPGYRILAPGEVDAETVERCAEVAAGNWRAPQWRDGSIVADAIRALVKESGK